MKTLEEKKKKKVYQTRLSEAQVNAIQMISFTVEKGEYIAIMGESGSGKSTLLNIIATLDKPSSGVVFINGMDTSHVSDQETAEFRRNNLGFVFQNFNLLDTFSVRDNILLPLVLAKVDIPKMDKRLMKLAKQLGINSLLDNYSYELSGGQQQRVAVARALITHPELLLADEPTGSLDSKTANQLLSIFQKVNEQGQTILMVTHSAVAASRANRVLFLKDGQIYHQLYRGTRTDDELLHAISDTMTSLLTKEA